MDILDGSGFWVTGDTAVVPPPPPAPSTGDGEYLVGGTFQSRYVDAPTSDPWAEIRAWLRKLVRRADSEWESGVTRARLARQDERDVLDARITRRRL